MALARLGVCLTSVTGIELIRGVGEDEVRSKGRGGGGIIQDLVKFLAFLLSEMGNHQEFWANNCCDLTWALKEK